MFCAREVLIVTGSQGRTAGASDSFRAPRDKRGRSPLIERTDVSVALC